MSYRQALMIFQVVVFFLGFSLLTWVDWRIAIGVLMAHWANNARIELDKE